jgi:L-alanine-DL-glutamate epimerase-like enolase superfamily enzyme
MMAVAAVDNALWDLKARLLGVPLVKLLGQVREAVPVYGSGGFTSYSEGRLTEQLAQWAGEGMAWVKMKVGRNPAVDVHRVRQARAALETTVGLFVDANGAYDQKQALQMARYFVDYGVSWFEEPVQHRDFEGLRFLREHAPAGMEIAGGEYGFNLNYFQGLIGAGCLDVVQVDATRFGISGFLQVATLCDSHNLPLSSHTAPALHLHLGAALERLRHMEYFHDHVRIERMLFDGLPEPVDGTLAPALDREGMGLEFRQADGRKFEISA